MVVNNFGSLKDATSNGKGGRIIVSYILDVCHWHHGVDLIVITTAIAGLVDGINHHVLFHTHIKFPCCGIIVYHLVAGSLHDNHYYMFTVGGGNKSLRESIFPFDSTAKCVSNGFVIEFCVAEPNFTSNIEAVCCIF